MQSPYEDLPPRAFWRTGVVGQPPEAIPDIYRRKFAIGVKTRVAAAGSCFAQHIARHMRTRGFTVLDVEPPPYGLPAEKMAQFGFGIYSARYGNIYTARQLRQLVEEAFGTFEPADAVWKKDGRYYDALRPSVEPNGLSSPEAVADQREWHLARVRKLVRKADVFVFTLGLTEAWIHSDSGTVYPSAPGVIAGEYDPKRHTFKNFGFQEVYDDVRSFFELANSHNPGLRLLLTVSPVPLTATASGEHVLHATIYSKSVLRAVAGQLCQEHPDIDYFPSYEIVTSPLAKSGFFENNLRSVRNDAVESVMRIFFAAHSDSAETSGTAPPETAAPPLSADDDDVVCEEVLLDAFAR